MKKVTLFKGDGIGPEISDSLLEIFRYTNIPMEFEIFDAGLNLFEKTGEVLSEESLRSFKKNKICLKAPITTPIGQGFRSVNVELRKRFDLYGNIRPIKSMEFIENTYKDIDMVIFRENTEDLYIGEEKMINDNEAIAIKRITREKSERIIKMAFDYARKNNRKKVTCVHKANILKLTDGLFLKVFNEIKEEYREIEAEDLIVDNMSMQLVLKPQNYDVLVMPNLYGDILSDLASGLVGGLGLISSVNTNLEYSMYEAVHGSAPDIAHKGVANPTAFILAGLMMLDDIGYINEAKLIRESIFMTLKDKDMRTKDLNGKANTKEYTEYILRNIDKLKENR